LVACSLAGAHDRGQHQVNNSIVSEGNGQLVPGKDNLDPYSVLGVSTDASIGEIREQFRLRALLLHPDRHAGDPEDLRFAAEKAMQDINDAYQLLVSVHDDGKGGNDLRVARQRGTSTRERHAQTRSSYEPETAAEACMWLCALIQASALDGGASIRTRDLRFLATPASQIVGRPTYRGSFVRTKRWIRNAYLKALDGKPAVERNGLPPLPQRWVRPYALVVAEGDPPCLLGCIDATVRRLATG
jgi:curved DNA-binding protein CbpA